MNILHIVFYVLMLVLIFYMLFIIARKKRNDTSGNPLQKISVAMMHNSPFPMWSKEVRKDEDGGIIFVMVELNLAYELTFIPAEKGGRVNYYNKTDVEFWGDFIGDIYYRNDMTTYRDKKIHSFVEGAKLAAGGEKDFSILKWWSTDPNTGKEYIHGMAIPDHLTIKKD